VGDPNVPFGEVARVEHAPAPLAVLGIVTVPVMLLGTGLTVSEAPGCKPFGPTGTPGTIPSEEVTSTGGVAVVIPICAKAAIWHKDEAPQIANIPEKATTFFFTMIAHIDKID
jgi:hypothetical protein